MAGNGPLVVFDSSANSLVNGDTNGSIDVFRTQALRCNGGADTDTATRSCETRIAIP